MCRCGVSCDYIYKKLEQAEREGKGYNLSVSILFPEDEADMTGTQEEHSLEPLIRPVE